VCGRLSISLSTLVKKSATLQSNNFVRVIEDAIDLLRNESGKDGNLTFQDRLVQLEPKGEAIVVGDLHGDLESLVIILKTSRFLEKMESNKDTTMVFLGDYGDRGVKSAEVYYIILTLKLTFPENIVLLRGNHEGPEELLASPHDLPAQFQHRFLNDCEAAYAKTRELFTYLYNAVLVEERYLMVHGGLSPEITSIQDLACAYILHPQRDFFEDLLWSDPSDFVHGVLYSPRGAGKLFGKDVTENVLAKLNVKILIRGHESNKEGYKIEHDGKVLTLFSRRGPPYFNQHGAYLELPLFEKFESAKHLVPWIHKF
jgi:protein phosphatase